MKTPPREPSTRELKIVRWTIGLTIVVLCAVLLWFELGWEREDEESVAATAPAAGGDMVPPADEGAAVPPAGAGDSSHTPADVIPPEEP